VRRCGKPNSHGHTQDCEHYWGTVSATVEHDDDPLAVWARVWRDYAMTSDDAGAAGDPN